MNSLFRWILHAVFDSSNPRSLACRFRKRRLQLLLEAFQPKNSSLLLEIGSHGSFFHRNWPFPERVIALDLVWRTELLSRSGLAVVADVRALPFKSGSVDILCNSVLEHVGPFDEQRRAAAEISRVGRKFFVQIPHKYFPVDPHYFTIPYFQLLPMSWQRGICRHIGVGYIPRGDFLEIHYLTPGQLAELFPGVRIVREKVLGVTKSLYALRV